MRPKGAFFTWPRVLGAFVYMLVVGLAHGVLRSAMPLWLSVVLTVPLFLAIGFVWIYWAVATWQYFTRK